ncbi:uncharacterized protein BDZ99DRAFT_407756 [Mytilinidion resinicola]|uniref:Zn(2)-C6 fungal-type domain-containing protein n=1 Tax=Mytilinidion resinicola TaxID=574789 RepID=A0A6A6Z098_9PEZI|nr:uncharacterized protein BDZ99DRAFT_407756 [Mytilinidion resinicola]KAF2814511.1 hypothetical protein BDZ99DRAFT_407756 [Mytilinidion resinicola]
MFATFTSSMDARSKSQTNGAPTSSRPKRHVAARACDRCRANRIKCDDGQPCKHCRVKDVECCKGRPGEHPDRSRVNELEAQLQQKSAQTSPAASSATAALPSPPDSEDTTSPGSQQSLDRRSTNSWVGFWKTDPNTKQAQYYGPTSFNFFLYRLGGYLTSSCNQPQLAEAMQAITTPSSHSTADSGTAAALSRPQEEGLLDMFWQSYHSMFPVLDEAEFRSHYNALWFSQASSPVETSRQPSALVDIILALCIQFSTAALASSVPATEVDSGNATQLGRWLYDRSQNLVRSEQDGPSISTLQVHIYSIIFLINCSLLPQAHGVLSAAVHVACALGLHHELPEDLPASQRSLLRRLWLMLFYLDSKCSLDLGRPFLIPWPGPGGTTEPWENDQHAVALVDTSNTNYEGINWLTCHNQYVKLMGVIRSISVSFSAKCDELLAAQPTPSLYSNPSVLEASASSLRQSLALLRPWISGVPTALKFSRKDGGEAFSATRYQVQFDAFAPIWLQRQRLLLELLYHNALLCLYRTFIKYPTPNAGPESLGPSITTLSVGNAVSALNHGIATIYIIDQAMIETDLLTSWHRAYQFLWEASVIVVGFTFARPLCPHTASARTAISTAIRAFGVFAAHGIAPANTAARILRELSSTSGDALGTFRSNFPTPAPAPVQNPRRSGDKTPVTQQPAARPGSDSFSAPPQIAHSRGSSNSTPVMQQSITQPRGSMSWMTQAQTPENMAFLPTTSLMNFPPDLSSNLSTSLDSNFAANTFSTDFPSGDMNAAFAEPLPFNSAPMSMDFSADMLASVDMQNAVQNMDWDQDFSVWPGNVGRGT